MMLTPESGSEPVRVMDLENYPGRDIEGLAYLGDFVGSSNYFSVSNILKYCCTCHKERKFQFYRNSLSTAGKSGLSIHLFLLIYLMDPLFTVPYFVTPSENYTFIPFLRLFFKSKYE